MSLLFLLKANIYLTNYLKLDLNSLSIVFSANLKIQNFKFYKKQIIYLSLKYIFEIKIIYY